MHGDKVFPVVVTLLISLGALIFFWKRKKPTMRFQDFHKGYAV